ncbi:MAG: GNAT family N-acetyltransferase [Candidatus Limnocylindrales bacterium]
MTEQAVTDDPVVVMGAPGISGLSFRRYRGTSDHAEMVRVHNAARIADRDTDITTVPGLTAEYASLTNCDPYQDCLMAEVAGRLVGYSKVDWVDENTGGRSYGAVGYIEPDWRRKGIGRTMLRKNEERMRQIASGHAHDRPRWLASWGSDPNVGNNALMEQEGYVPARYFYEMIRADLDAILDVPLPDGLEVRTVTQEHIRPIFEADVEAFRDHWGWVDASETGFRQWTTEPEFDPSMFVIAWDGDQIAGGVLNGIYPAENEQFGYRRGWLNSVFTRRPWRRRGLAAALISRSLVLVRERGMTSAALGVDAENPQGALHLYEKAGFAIGTSATAFRKPFDPAIGPEWGNEPRLG